MRSRIQNSEDRNQKPPPSPSGAGLTATGVFAPPHRAPFVFARRDKIQLNPFASAKPSSGPTDALPSQIVKEQPIRLAEMRQTKAANPPLASDHFIALPEKTDGGAGRDRTDGLLLAKQALSQLSYGPDSVGSHALSTRRCCQLSTVNRLLILVGLDGFEPSTPALSRRCSNQLSYRPNVRFGCHSLQPIGVGADRAGRRGPGAGLRPLLTSVPCYLSPESEKGGDPAAPSDTATLLRLHPSHESYRGKRPPCG